MPHCGSESIAKAGIRKLKRSLCKGFVAPLAKKYFRERKIGKVEYPIRIILNTILTYNLGYTLEQTRK